MSNDLYPISKTCGQANAPGTKALLYLCPSNEFDGWPGTRDVVSAGTENEDPIILDEPFSFVATSGQGYWRKIEIIRDTGQVQFPMEGEIGGRAFNNQILFQIAKVGSNEKQFARLMANACLVGMIQDRNGTHHVIGNDQDPAILETIEGDTGQAIGDVAGINFVLQHPDGLPPYTYDADTHGINETPNV